MSTNTDTLANALSDLLTGELKVGLGLISVGKALKEETAKKNRTWITKGLKKFLDENEEALPILAAALGAGGVEKAKEWINRNRPS